MQEQDQFAPGGSTLAELMDENGGRQLVGYEAELLRDLKKESARGCAIGFRSRPTIHYAIPTPKKLPEPATQLDQIWQRNQAG